MMMLVMLTNHDSFYTYSLRAILMTDRETIQKEMEAKLAKGEATLAKLKAKMADAGDDASDELAKAISASESFLEKGKAKASELTAASDEEFDKLWASTKDTWSSMTSDIESGWNKLSEKVKGFLS